MRWIFREVGPNEVETEVTQRDHFRNDEVDLSDTVVREAIQNSLDARRNGEQVHVRFALREGLSKTFLNHIFVGQVDHARAAGVIGDDFDTENGSALVIEDFGTKGLTGEVNRRDDDNFSDFWRRHGKSHKSGKSGGRWGLGKLVYSYASRVGAFFGVTFREGDDSSYLMGQTVLNTHELNSKKYAPHGFFADELADGPEEGLQVPFRSHQLNTLFEKQFDLHRKCRRGLSVVVPYPREEIDLNRMTAVAVENYFFPVLTERLIVTVGPTTINHETLRDVTNYFVDGDVQPTEALFSFVEAAHNTTEEDLHKLTTAWYDDWKLDADDFEAEELEVFKQRFASGDLVALRLPIVIKKKDGTSRETHFDLFVKHAPTLKHGRDLYVRGAITVPGEAKFRHRKALGALVAQDDAVSEFLGDAENAAHTKWNGKAEKLSNYKYSYDTLRAIRNSLVRFLDILLQAAEEEAEDALLDFFWAPKRADGRRKKRNKRSPPKQVVIPKPQPKPVVVESTTGGFALAPGPAVDGLALPARFIVTMAYDTLTGDPLKNYTEYDFKAEQDLSIDITGAKQTVARGNTLEFEISEAKFRIDVSGFDTERDIVTRVIVTEDVQ